MLTLLALALALQATDTSITRDTISRSYVVPVTVQVPVESITVRITSKTDTQPTPPPMGQVYFRGDAENGTITTPWHPTYVPYGTGGLKPVTTSERKKNGKLAYKFEITAAGALKNAHYSQLYAGEPQVPMAGKKSFQTGWYSTWVYIESGYTAADWNMLLGWMTATPPPNGPSPISSVGIRIWKGKLVMHYVLSNAAVTHAPFRYTAPNIPGYENASNGYYFMTASSPNGIVEFPRQKWVHLSIYYKMAEKDGQVVIWQDGVKIMDLTAPTFNTFGGSSFTEGANANSGMTLQFGIYGGPDTGVQKIYPDDFLVTDQRVAP